MLNDIRHYIQQDCQIISLLTINMKHALENVRVQPCGSVHTRASPHAQHTDRTNHDALDNDK